MKRLAVTVALALAGCATTPAPPPAPAYDAASLVAGIRAAGMALPTEVDVQPLQDTAIADLREQARTEERAGDLDGAAAALDRALAERATDPTLLQERAEIALLMRAPETAFDFARRARGAGPTVGPLCRRSIETLVQVERLRAATDPAAAARADAFARERDACTVKPPPRY